MFDVREQKTLSTQHKEYAFQSLMFVVLIVRLVYCLQSYTTTLTYDTTTLTYDQITDKQ
jgi:hypothetical protein